MQLWDQSVWTMVTRLWARMVLGTVNARNFSLELSVRLVRMNAKWSISCAIIFPLEIKKLFFFNKTAVSVRKDDYHIIREFFSWFTGIHCHTMNIVWLNLLRLNLMYPSFTIYLCQCLPAFILKFWNLRISTFCRCEHYSDSNLYPRINPVNFFKNLKWSGNK